MKFNCDRCQTRYSIGDDKVRGKVLKIRCKTCGNIVVVREQTSTMQPSTMQVPEAAGAVGAASAVSSSAVSASAISSAGSGAPTTSAGGSGVIPPPSATGRSSGARAGDVDWYVAIKGKQHGPCKRDDVGRLFRDGKITERTYLWNEGMASWTRLRDISDFASLLNEAASPARRPLPPPPPTDGEPQGAEIIPFDEARRAREGGVSAITNDPFAAVSSPLVGGDGAPRDSTRVFIMQAGLHNRGKKHRAYGAAAAVALLVLVGAGVLDYKGVIEIPGLHSVVNVVTQKVDEPKPSTHLAEWDDAEEDPKLKCKLNPNPEECVRQTIASNERKRAKKAAGLGGSGVAGINLEESFQNGPGGESGATRKTSELGEAAGISDAERRAFASMKKDEKRLQSPTMRPDVQTGPVAGADISAENVSKVVKENQAAIQDCIEKAAKVGDAPRGKHYLTVSIEPNGRVSAARFANGAVNASQAGECITRAAKKWKFAPFPGPTTDVEIPLVLSLN